MAYHAAVSQAGRTLLEPRNVILPAIRVVVADDSEELRAGLHEELGTEFTIVGTAHNGEQAVREVGRLDPDIVVLDINMPLLNGLEAARQLRDLHPRTKILFLTIHEQSEYIAAAFAAGALGYVTKRHLASDLSQAVREVAEGRTFLSPSLRRPGTTVPGEG